MRSPRPNLWPLFVSSVLWTGVLCAWCGEPIETCTGNAAFIQALGPAAAGSRTDAEGRWPAIPGGGSLDLALGNSAVRSGGGGATRAQGERASADTTQSSQYPSQSLTQFKPQPNGASSAGPSRSRRTRDPRAALLSLYPERRVRLEVHTDAGGSAASQAHTAELRAGAVRDWSVERSQLQAGPLEAIAAGASRPLVPPDGSYAAQQPNRRLEVSLLE